MKYIKLNPTFDLCEQLEGELFQESNTSCPLEEGPVTLIAKKLIPEDVPKVSVTGNITLTNQDGETLTCTTLSPDTRVCGCVGVSGFCEWGLIVGVHIDVVLKGADGSNRFWFF